MKNRYKNRIECPFSAERLHELYWKNGLSTTEIADLAANLLERHSFAASVVLRWLKEAKINTRDRSHQQKLLVLRKPDIYQKLQQRGLNAKKTAPHPIRITPQQREKMLRGQRRYFKTNPSVKLRVKCSFPGCQEFVWRYPADVRKSKHQRFYCSPTHRYTHQGQLRRSAEILKSLSSKYIKPVTMEEIPDWLKLGIEVGEGLGG